MSMTVQAVSASNPVLLDEARAPRKGEDALARKICELLHLSASFADVGPLPGADSLASPSLGGTLTAAAVGAAACEAHTLAMTELSALPAPASDPSQWVKTKTGHVIARQAVLNQTQRIKLVGKCVIAAGATLRADLSNVSCGELCFLGRESVLQPPSKTVQGVATYVPVSVGDFVTIGDSCRIEAAAIGSHVFIGDRVVVGARCIVKDCCMLLPDCELPPDTTAAPFTIWAGSPAKCIGELPAGYREDRYSQAKTLYASWEAPMRAV